tara:strand:- start:88 stop:645 length:558 start_codon:yes stop_codon:yes gene_type:complete
MKHKHEKFIKLFADGVKIDCTASEFDAGWQETSLSNFNVPTLRFRISPNQPADNQGWIPWYGGETPAISERIDVLFKDWPIQKNTTAGQWRWEIKHRKTDILAYRIVKPAEVKKWRWMYTTASNNSIGCLYLTPAMTEAEVKVWAAGRPSGYKLGPRQDWTEVTCPVCKGHALLNWNGSPITQED